MTRQGAKAYQQTSVTTTDPATLILMLYDGAIKNLLMAREGIKANDIKKRGEHMSKAIAIITELLSSVQGDDSNEVATFLKNMYSSMLTELVKVNLNNDPEPVELSIKYLAQMRNIWQTEVMNGEGKKALEERHNANAGHQKMTFDNNRNTITSSPFTQASHCNVTYNNAGLAVTA